MTCVSPYSIVLLIVILYRKLIRVFEPNLSNFQTLLGVDIIVYLAWFLTNLRIIPTRIVLSALFVGRLGRLNPPSTLAWAVIFGTLSLPATAKMFLPVWLEGVFCFAGAPSELLPSGLEFVRAKHRGFPPRSFPLSKTPAVHPSIGQSHSDPA